MRRPRLVEESLWLALAQGGSVLARLAGVKILTTLLTPSAYGEATLLLGIAAFGTNVFCLPLLQASLRFYPEAVAARRLRPFRHLMVRRLAAALVLLLLVLALGVAVYDASSWGTIPPAAAIAVGALLVADTARMFEAGLLNAARRQRAFSLWSLLDAWARPACAVAAVLALSASGTGVIVGTFAGCVLAALPFLPLLETGRDDAEAEGGPAWRAGLSRDVTRFALPLVPNALFGWIVGIGDRYVIAAIAGTAQAGLYAAAYGLASQPFLALSALGVAALRPILFQAVADGDAGRFRQTVARWTLTVLGVGAVGVVAVAVFARPLMRLLTGPAFAEAAPLLPWIAAGYALQCVQYVFETVLYAGRATGRLLAIQVVGAAAAVGLYAALIPRYGAMGAAWATFGSFVASTTASILLARGVNATISRR